MNIGDKVYRAVAFAGESPWISIASYVVEHLLHDCAVCRTENGDYVITAKRSELFPTQDEAREAGRQRLRESLELIKQRYAEEMSDAS